MGFDALLKKKSFKTYKFKATVSLAISRLAVLKNQRQVRCSIARSDVIQLLNIGHHERALLRVEVVIKEQNMLDAFVMMEGYCDLLIERLHQIEQEKTCPEELKEAASSLIYASTRCGEFPELQEIRSMLAAHFGKDFVARAVELRNNCGVNTKMIQKLSTRMPALENRIKVLKDIASENNIVLLLDDVILETSEDKVKEAQPNSYTTKKYEDSKTEIFLQAATELEAVEGVTDKKRYKNVADAAQAAFESAAYAAAAARAAVELSRADSHDPSDNHHSPITPNLHSKENSCLQEPENSISNIEEEKIHPVQNDVSESDKEEEATKTIVEEFKQERNNESKGFMRSISTLSSEESDNEDLVKKLVETEINFDESEDEKTSKDNTMSPRTQDLGLESKQTVPGNYGPDNEKVGNKESDSIEARPYSPAHKFFLFGSRARSKTGDKSSDNNSGHCLTGMFRVPKDDLLGKDKVPISVRTRRTFRWGQ